MIDCYTSYFNEHRLHQGIGNRIPAEYNFPSKRQGGRVRVNLKAGNVIRKDFLGGLLKSYQKAA